MWRLMLVDSHFSNTHRSVRLQGKNVDISFGFGKEQLFYCRWMSVFDLWNSLIVSREEEFKRGVSSLEFRPFYVKWETRYEVTWKHFAN